MSNDKYNPAADPFMIDLFRQEADTHCKVLTDGILDLERTTDAATAAEPLMRAAHSIKGAARMVGFDIVVDIAHTMEDCFVAAQKNEIVLTESHIDVLLKAVDMITSLSEGRTDDINDDILASLKQSIRQISTGSFPSSASEGNDATTPVSTTSALDTPQDNGMLELFRADALSLYSKTITIIDNLSSALPGKDELSSIHNHIHMIGGGAKLAGQSILAALCVNLDKSLLSYIENDLDINEETFQDFQTLLLVMHEWILNGQDSDLSGVAKLLKKIETIETAEKNSPAETGSPAPVASTEQTQPTPSSSTADSSIRISTRRMNRLVGLASENVVEARWVRSHADAMLVYKRRQTELIAALDGLRNHLDKASVPEHIYEIFNDVQRRANDSRAYLAPMLTDLEDFDRRITALSERLNHEVLQTRMRPFMDCTHGFERMLRDIARKLGKRVKLNIIGGNTQVDREILTRIEAPLNHILRNAVDHGIETMDERLQLNKPESANITLEAAHNMGMLAITISDDGRGVNIESLRKRIVERKLVSAEMATNLSDSELLDFLYLPGFSTRNDVTEISGRGVGLDVVHNTIQEMRGQIRTFTSEGNGLRIQLMLPLTLSVIRSLLVEIGGQPYAMPLARIDSIHTLDKRDIDNIDGKQFFLLNGRHIGLVDAAQVLEAGDSTTHTTNFSIVVVGDRQTRYGLVVDRFMGERDLAVHILDPRLGKIRDISAATLLENGSPALIIDIDDIVRSIELLISGERLNKIERSDSLSPAANKKTILVVDDSITVREVERKLLESHGYAVDVAVDGMDGWNAVQNSRYDLVISDIDMPRMNGIEFVTMLKNDANYKSLPVMIVSYKDRQEDRDAGLQAGADYYLTKGSFHDDSLIDAVIDLIGEP